MRLHDLYLIAPRTDVVKFMCGNLMATIRTLGEEYDWASMRGGEYGIRLDPREAIHELLTCSSQSEAAVISSRLESWCLINGEGLTDASAPVLRVLSGALPMASSASFYSALELIRQCLGCVAVTEGSLAEKSFEALIPTFDLLDNMSHVENAENPEVWAVNGIWIFELMVCCTVVDQCLIHRVKAAFDRFWNYDEGPLSREMLTCFLARTDSSVWTK